MSKTAPLPANPDEAAVAEAVRQVVHRARSAQAVADGWSQARVDEVVAAAAWAILEPGRNRELAELAVADTGVGDVDDKVRKNHRKTLGLLRDLHGMKTVDVIAELPELGLIEIARPVGVVAAITPSTNPAATPANKIINALKARNAIVVAPSPKGRSTCARLIEFIHAQFDRIDAPRDLVQMLPGAITKASTAALMREADLVVATGSQSNVRAAYTCGTPAFGVGAGNVASIVDETADCDAAARLIVRSKTFDNATSCSSENSVVVVRAARDRLLASLASRGVVLLDDARKATLQRVMWPDGKLSGDVIGKSAARIAALAGFDDLARRPDLRVLMVAETAYGPTHPYSGEKLSPVLALYTAHDFDDARRIVEGIYGYMGAGHSVGLHSSVAARAVELGLRLPVARVILNQAHCIATGGSFDNGLPFSLSMGCGTWGGNNFSDNMTVRHYLNVTRVSRPIAERVPAIEDLLGAFFAKHGR
jgi:sulfoacetaldehyde dehydrogenase